MKRFFFCILITLISCCTWAQLTENSKVWLVSCTPGIPTWAHYGHSAIRIQDSALKIDNFYNYGIFDFRQPDFYSNFVKGKTDYMLCSEDSASFYWDYEETGRQFYTQLLNLNLEQKNSLFIALEVNALPENRAYRYNFVYDNCATRPYQLIKNVIGGELYAPQYSKRQDSFRDRIAYYSGKNTWGGWGINLLFGRDADKIMTTEQRMFLPEELMDFAEEAVIITQNTPQKLVVESTIQPFVPRDASWWFSPYFTIILIILLIISISIIDTKHKKISWWLDGILFFIYGTLGCLLTYLAIWSEHPFVSNNFNILFLNPIMFVPFILLLFEKGRKWLLKADTIFGIYFCLTLIVYLASGQTFHTMIWILIVHAIRIRFIWYRNVFLLGQKTIRKIHKPAKATILTALLALCCIHAEGQTSRLTVVVMVDGLNHQTLRQLTPALPPGGLRTILDDGQGSRLYFPQMLNGGCESVATISTGTTPFYHGIAANTRFDPHTQNIIPILEDRQYSGIGSRLHYSPKALLSPSITDLFRLNNSKDSRIYAIGIYPENTILLAGHAANACIWLDTSRQQPYWATTNYYPVGLHPLADQMNTNGSLLTLYNQKWANRMPVTDYIRHSINEQQKNGFAYSCNKSDHGFNAAPIQRMPAVNSMVINLACDIQQHERLGEGLQNDLLLIELTCRTPATQSDFLELAEQQDMYLCLNQDLQKLILQLNRRVGSQNYRLILIGKPELGHSDEALTNAHLPHGTFNVAQAAALLNTYLMAIYGNGQYIIGGHNNSIYLNYPLFQRQKINTNHLIQLATQFLLEFEGVQSVYTAAQIPLLQGSARETEGKLRRSYNKQCFGDILITLQPGYKTVNSDDTTDQITDSDPEVPIYILGKAPNMPTSFAATQVLSLVINE